MRVKRTINFSRKETYYDFIMRLIYYFDYYYLDINTLYEDEDIKNHFSFIFKKTCSDFEKEGLFFYNNNKLFDYLFGYFYANLYVPYDPNQKYDIKLIRKFWNSIFDIKNQRNDELIIILTELYEIFDISLNTSSVLVGEIY